jgi:hypothetical protein
VPKRLGRRRLIVRHRNRLQPRGPVEPCEGVPRLRHGAAQPAQVPDQGRFVEFGDETADGGVVDGLWGNSALARPPAQPRKTMARPLVGGRQKPGPVCIEVEASGLEHRPQARRADGAGKAAAQVRPPLSRHLGLGGRRAVEGPADVG